MIDQKTAAASLNDIETARQRTFQAVVYDISSLSLILWGVLTTAGYLCGQFWPTIAGPAWLLLNVSGYIGTGLILRHRSHAFSKAHRQHMIQSGFSMAALVAFGAMMIWFLGPLTYRQLDAFWPLVFMFAYVIAGIWIGRFFLFCGLIVAALTLVGYYWAGPWYGLWMAVFEGTALTAGGFWLRRMGAAL